MRNLISSKTILTHYICIFYPKPEFMFFLSVLLILLLSPAIARSYVHIGPVVYKWTNYPLANCDYVCILKWMRHSLSVVFLYSFIEITHTKFASFTYKQMWSLHRNLCVSGRKNALQAIFYINFNMNQFQKLCFFWKEIPF